MSPNTIGFVDREGASACLNQPAAFGAKLPSKRPRIRAKLTRNLSGNVLGAEILRRAARPGVTVLGCSQRASSPSRARRARLVDDHNRLAERLLYLAGDEPVI
jgi:hypothetical protein